MLREIAMKKKLIIFGIMLLCFGVLMGCAHRSQKYECRNQAVEYCKTNKEHNTFTNCIWIKYIECLDDAGLLFNP